MVSVPGMARKIKTLLFSTLFPSRARALHGIFVETRLRELLKSGRVETRVLAPVPWFPFVHPRFGAYAAMARTPAREQREGVEVYHPRYPLPPKVGQNVAPYLLAAGSLPTARRLIREGFDFDLIDAHFFYPDGVAASLLARHLGKPFVCTARGSDINLYQQFSTPRRLIAKTLEQSAANIGVSADLVKQMVALGADSGKCHTIRNGVDLERFVPLDPAESRAALGLPARGLMLLMVGHLVELKGHHLVIEMLKGLPDAHLVIVGAGERLAFLQSLALSLGVQTRVHFGGQQANDELKRYYSAADVLLLASSREGWPNVLLEAMACGTPVVATLVNGTPEIVSAPEAGRLAAERSPASLRAALDDLLARYPQRRLVRAFAERFSWAETTQRQVDLFEAVLSERGARLAAGNAQERVVHH
jgi:teichuronic acid biosynthesis glycosyltransferase TuaC